MTTIAALMFATAFTQPHLGPGTGGTSKSQYVSVELPFAPFEKARKEVETRASLKLEHRGEAHITLITPPEFEELATVLSANEIHSTIGSVLTSAKLKSNDIRALCVGRGRQKADQTYFVVLVSHDLLEARRKLEALYHAKGGEGSRFAAEAFYPHVTLGFTKRDLHLQDGVIKGRNACVWPIQ